MKSKKIFRFILIFLISGIAFFLLTLPFHKILAVFTVSEVRPSAVLYPFLGISFGWPAALGITVANFISDALNGYSLPILLEGIVPQILYTIVPYYLWRLLMRGEDHKHRLDCIGRVMKFVLICLAFSLLSAVGVGLIVHFNFGANTFETGFFVLMNNFDVSVMLGCPLMVISNQLISRHDGSERILTRNEKIIIITAIVQIIALATVVIAVYTSGKTFGTYDIWNTIYFLALVVNNLIMVLSLMVMFIFGKTDRADAK